MTKPKSKRNPDRYPFSWELATLDDLAACVELSIGAYDELINPPKLGLEKVAVYMYDSINDKRVVVYKNNGVCCGILALDYQTLWFADNDSPVLTNAVFYIKPEFRSFKAASSALRLAEQYAKINKTPLHITFFTDKDVKRKHKLFKHRGYTSQGFLVTKSFL